MMRNFKSSYHNIFNHELKGVLTMNTRMIFGVSMLTMLSACQGQKASHMSRLHGVESYVDTSLKTYWECAGANEQTDFHETIGKIVRAADKDRYLHGAFGAAGFSMPTSVGVDPLCESIRKHFADEDLYLDLAHQELNNVQGALTASFTYLFAQSWQPKHLVGLDLSGNQIDEFFPFEGALFQNGMKSLLSINISGNRYGGAWDRVFPKDKTAGLLILDASNNGFISDLPDIDQNVGASNTYLQKAIYVSLRANDMRLSGNKPSYLRGSVANLKYLDMSFQTSGRLELSFEASSVSIDLAHLSVDYLRGWSSPGVSGSVGSFVMTKGANTSTGFLGKPFSGIFEFLDLRAYGPDPAIIIDAASNAPRHYWRSPCLSESADRCTSDIAAEMPLGGCSFYKAIKPLGSMLTDQAQVESFQSSLAPYEALGCGV